MVRFLASHQSIIRRCRSKPSSSVAAATRSEEHTSELQSQSNLVCRLLLEKKKHRSPCKLGHVARLLSRLWTERNTPKSITAQIHCPLRPFPTSPDTGLSSTRHKLVYMCYV